MEYSYRYDQLNRLVTTYKHDLASGLSTWDNSTINANYDYAESATYDGNGNILTYNRNASTNANTALLARRASPGRMAAQANRLDASFAYNAAMDRMTYNYNVDNNSHLLNNRLRHINDSVDPNAYSVDIDDQQPDNYTYDNIGHLTGDIAEGLYNINWTVYGKLANLNKTDGTALTYNYDPSGNRITKTFTSPNGQDYNSNTYYVRDAQGNVLGVYTTSGNNSSYNWQEQHLYGSSRLGMAYPFFQITSDAYLPNDSYNEANDPVANSGNRIYELTNHLGNVLATINDLPVPVDDYNTAYVFSSQDYYPFGMLEPGRASSNSEIGYRYGFNGKEKDDEVKGVGNQQDYGMRIYDPRAGRFLSVDPITKEYPELTPYQFASNTPIEAIDLDGLEGFTLSGFQGQQVRNAEAKIAKLHQITERDIMMQDIHGTIVIGRESWVKAHVIGVRQQYYNNIGENIRGGLFGSLGYIIDGDRGSNIAAPLDQIAVSFGGIPDENSSVLSKPKNITIETPPAYTEAPNKQSIETNTNAIYSNISVEDAIQNAANAAKLLAGKGTGAVYGTKVHTQLKKEINALAKLGFDVSPEISYLNGKVVQYGTQGSVRADIVVGNINAPIAVYDLKTGSAKLTQSEITKYKSNLPRSVKTIKEIKPNN